MNYARSQSSQKFKGTTTKSACVICNNTSGHCKTKDGDRGDLLHYCHNNVAKPQGAINGYWWTSAAGTWGVFSTEKPKYQGASIESSRSRNPHSKPKMPNYSIDRHEAFKAYMQPLTLHPDDRADLLRRCITESEIASWGVVSIEGNEPGCIVPCYAPNGQIVGAQWRLRGVTKGTRYKWVNWLGGGSKNGEELPLTVHRPIGITPTGIAVCEGIGAKSFILAQRSGMVTIGAGTASQFTSSLGHWESYLSELSIELNTKKLTFYPDAGAVRNESVCGQYGQWFEAIEELGYEIKIAWWGQTEKGESPDPDQLTSATEIELISVDEFLAMSPKNAIGEIPWECLSSHLEQLGFWKTQELGKNEAEQAKVDSLIEEMKVNPNIKYSGSRSVQGTEKQDGYTLHTFSVFNPLMNLDFHVTKMIESPDGGMIELKVRQKQGDRVKTQKALIKSTDTTKVDTFVNALKKAIGRNLVCNLKPPHLQALLQNRTAQYQISGGKTFRLAPRTGRQDDGFWVFENTQFNPKGEVCTEDESLWMFNPSLGVDEQVVSPKIAPQNKDALLNLIKAAQKYYHAETFPLALMTIGYGVATVHRDYIYEAYSSLPQMNVFGDAGGGKTLAAIMASSLFGTHIAPVSRFTESVIFETVKSIGSLLLVIDDPLKKERRGGDLAVKVDNFVWDMYGTNARKVRGNEQKPHTNVIITSNKAIGEDTAAIESRLIKVSFPKREFNQFGRHAVSDAIAGATGGLGQLIGMKFDNQAIKKVALQLTPHLTGAHARLTDSYAILTHYTQRLCDLAGFEFNALEYCINNLCPKANTFESDKCSLTDFLEKLATLRTKGVVGEWDVSQVKKRGHKSYLAINMVSVWPIFEREYPHVNYSRQSIEALISERGGINNSSQKFIKDKAVWMDYQRALNQYRMAGGQGSGDKSLEPIKPSKTSTARCSLIPTAIVDEAIGGEDATTTNYSDNASPSWESTPPTAEETTPTPDEVKVGDYATVRVNLPEVELKAGDRVAIIEVQQDQESGGWFAIARSDNQGKRFSLWLNDLQATGQVADPSG